MIDFSALAESLSEGLVGSRMSYSPYIYVDDLQIIMSIYQRDIAELQRVLSSCDCFVACELFSLYI